jgi:hypothetical protein
MAAEITMREIQHKQTQLQTEFIMQDNRLKKLIGENITLQAELIKLKHQMNNLGR